MALLLSHADAPQLLGRPDTVILDELHALAPHQARRPAGARSCPARRPSRPATLRIGLSATVARPSELRAYLMPQSGDGTIRLADLVIAEGGARPDIAHARDRGAAALGRPHHPLRRRRDLRGHQGAPALSLVFVNTRSQAELLFQELWRINDDSLPIALHHGSLDAARRRKVEAAMAAGALKAVVCHLHARPRHRLGRRRPRHQCRRAQGREPADPARRPRQPPPRRALARAAGALQPLRGAGMPRGHRCGQGRRPRRRAIPHGRARRAGPARVGHGLRRAVRARRALPRGRLRRALRRPDARRSSTASSISSPTGGYALQRLRALCAAEAHAETAACGLRIRASPSNTA